VRIVRYRSAGWRAFKASLSTSARPQRELEHAVKRILAEVRRNGDAALVRLTAKFDGVRLTPARLHVRREEVLRLAARADRGLVRALEAMASRIEAFHRRQLSSGFRMALPGGAVIEELVRPIASAGLYVPGGAGAYPSSVLMNALPARLAGVARIQVATPPATLERNPAVAAALVIAGVEGEVFRVGGAQAVGALAFGTRSVPAVDKIVGPGNAYVAAAKRLVRGVVDVDTDAGPSEVVIVADATADAGWVAADLLAQAEHGSGQEVAVLVTPSEALAKEVAALVPLGLRSVANAGSARRALRARCAVVLVSDLAEGVTAANDLAPEHAELVCRGAETLARAVVAGAVFVGGVSPGAVGDYGIGPNHVLPTGGSARRASPLSVRDFQRRSSLTRMTERGLARVADDMARVAVAEGFIGHAQSLLTRFAR
jgi:histidinol dehydrogenase